MNTPGRPRHCPYPSDQCDPNRAGRYWNRPDRRRRL